MKTFKLKTFAISGIIMLMVTLFFSSCGKDEKDDAIELSGKWILKKENLQVFINGELTDTNTEFYSNNNSYIEFNNGFMTFVSADEEDGEIENEYVVSYTLSSDSKIITLDCSNGNNCPIIAIGGIKVKEVSSKNLILYWEVEESAENTTYKYTSENYFVR